MLVQSIPSPRSGKPVKNQFIIQDSSGSWFQSYRTMIARKKNGVVYLSQNWNYSKTTSKYLCIFLEVASIKNIRESIANGKYLVVPELDAIG